MGREGRKEARDLAGKTAVEASLWRQAEGGKKAGRCYANRRSAHCNASRPLVSTARVTRMYVCMRVPSPYLRLLSTLHCPVSSLPTVRDRLQTRSLEVHVFVLVLLCSTLSLAFSRFLALRSPSSLTSVPRSLGQGEPRR
ncbi:hypothetical protein L226DRAFT_177283 [Lentinus tigrinus ALCF2SS1-7]|uniref:uncharacterized protein n=1 Tax=Lentinus tigrinus ALCF2SS1-7 TaxID=1328758 RepID=UPI0011663763|nr:hypothetical protein L226DRAFT_177283 [Lentinus tigrinus ALCF2SS1-7]